MHYYLDRISSLTADSKTIIVYLYLKQLLRQLGAKYFWEIFPKEMKQIINEQEWEVHHHLELWDT